MHNKEEDKQINGSIWEVLAKEYIVQYKGNVEPRT